MLLDLEKEVITYASDRGLSPIPRVNPAQLHGLEINPTRQQLAQVVIWIGYLQWMHYNGFKMPDHPVLTPIETIRQMDAILDLSDPEHPKEPEWPEAEFIVGNPPFLGERSYCAELGRRLCRGAFLRCTANDSRVSPTCVVIGLRELAADRSGKVQDGPVCWRRKGSAAAQIDRCWSGSKRPAIIFFAESDRNWILDGASVHVRMVGFDDGSESTACWMANR